VWLAPLGAAESEAETAVQCGELLSRLTPLVGAAVVAASPVADPSTAAGSAALDSGWTVQSAAPAASATYTSDPAAYPSASAAYAPAPTTYASASYSSAAYSSSPPAPTHYASASKVSASAPPSPTPPPPAVASTFLAPGTEEMFSVTVPADFPGPRGRYDVAVRSLLTGARKVVTIPAGSQPGSQLLVCFYHDTDTVSWC
jgi:hypothetical protein